MKEIFSMKKISRGLILVLLAALMLRIVVVMWSLQLRENTDVIRYKDAARIAFLYGLEDSYKTAHLTFGTLPFNQPQGSLYILYGSYILELQAAKAIFKFTHTNPTTNPWVNGPLLTIFLKIPSIIADLILGALIYFFVKKSSSEKNALIGSSLYLFTPPVWYNSAFWGQMDALNNLMFFAAILFLFQAKYFWSVLTGMISIFIKFSLLPIIPVFFYLLFIKKKTKRKQLIPIFLVCTIIIFTLTLPVSKLNFSWIFDFFKINTLGEMQFITNFAFNFWWTVFHPSISLGSPNSLFSFSEVRLHNSPLDSTTYFFLPLFAWAIILFLGSCLPILKKIYDLKEKILLPQNMLLIFCLLNLLSFIFLPRMHERYLYPLFPVMAALVGLSGRYLKTFIIFSILNFINLYIAWHPMQLFNLSMVYQFNYCLYSWYFLL
ncbi:hypothetical protein HZA75_06700 [Candidatus Roizmanbacteria bacterium]|nr:hypothetical protein [Candidatus Roizmanbacteria bacterium]